MDKENPNIIKNNDMMDIKNVIDYSNYKIQNTSKISIKRKNKKSIDKINNNKMNEIFNVYINKDSIKKEKYNNEDERTDNMYIIKVFKEN